MSEARTAVITGASSGIGLAAAKALAAQGWAVIGTGRDAARMASAKAAIEAAGTGAKVTMLAADLSLLKDAERLAGEIAKLTSRIDLLANNAGGMTDRMVMTSEGLEANYAANHLGAFVLTECLLPLLRDTAKVVGPGKVRIVMTSSDASEMIPTINLDDLQNLNTFSTGAAYCSGKLANVLFARGLAKRLAADGIVAHAYAPGPVDSNFLSYAPADTQERMKAMDKFTVEQGADTLIWLATGDEGGQSSGGYWEHRLPRKPHALADNPAFVEQFWQASGRLVAGVI